jgi:MFS family permease
MTSPAALTTRNHTDPQVVSARRLLVAVFAVLGIVMAAWGARMPAVQATANVGPGQLALALLAAAVGMVIGLQAGGRIAQRRGPASLLIAPTLVFGLSLVALGQCRSLLSLSLVAVVFGAAHGLLDVGANAAAVECQKAAGRPIMVSLHASYSFGALSGAALTAVSTDLSHKLLFAIVGVSTAVAALAAAPAVRSVAGLTDAAAVGSQPSPIPEAPQGRTLPRRSMWLLGGLAAACLLAEGAAADWSAVHLRGLGGSEAIAAAAYAVYSGAMATGRLFGDRLVARFGPAAVVRAGAALAAVGLGAGTAAGSLPMALAGWTALGLGLSTAVPSLITAAGRGGPRAVGTVAATGYLGLLAGPAVIGLLASLTTLPAALALPVLLAAVVAAASRRALEHA